MANGSRPRCPSPRPAATAFVVACLVLAAGAPGRAQQPEVVLCVDVPSVLGATRYHAYQIVRKDAAGLYAVQFQDGALGADIHFDGYHRMADGSFLFSADAPFTAGGVPYGASDIVRCVPGVPTYSLYQGAGPAGLNLPLNTNVDAIAMDASGNLLISFQSPTGIGAMVTAQSGDVVKVDKVTKAMSIVFDWSTRTGLSDDYNVNGIEAQNNGDHYFTIDVPIKWGMNDFAPGTLIRWNSAASSFTLYWSDGAFPAGSVVSDFGLAPSPGAVPDGSTVPGPAMTAAKSGARVFLGWAASCSSAGVNDYVVYEGTLGAFTSHVPAPTTVACSTGGATQATFTPSAGDRYYLVVPRNSDFEGSYGVASGGVPRPASAAACKPQKSEPCS